MRTVFEPAELSPGRFYRLLTATIVPRPIAWVSTVSADGVANVAPYSFFTVASVAPPVVQFTSVGRKDSVRNIEETGEFVCNLATWDLRDQMNATSAPLPRGVNEMETAGLEAAPSRLVTPPRVKASPCALECKLLQIVPIADIDGRPVDSHVVFGQVIGVHIEDRFVIGGLLETAAMRPVARAGYHNYAVVESQFTMVRPTR